MNPQTLQATAAGLLHDVGKLVVRAGEKRAQSAAGHAWLSARLTDSAWQPVLAGLRWRTPAQDGLACIISAANAVASMADVGPEEGTDNTFDASLPLCSVFTHLNGQHPRLTIPPTFHDGRLHLPVPNGRVTPDRYAQLLRELSDGLKRATLDEAWLDALLARCTANVPASVRRGTQPDVSLFDHLKLTAAVSACISEYLLANGRPAERRHLCSAGGFRQEKAFLMYSADCSGIQKFIYTVATKGAQCSLRSRSFFLEPLMEHYVDSVLSACGLSRANLIYSGGGHCYILLRNTKDALEHVQRVNADMNDWLMEQFGIRLYLAHG